MRTSAPCGRAYRGFRAAGAAMRKLADLDASVNGAVRTDGDGCLGRG